MNKHLFALIAAVLVGLIANAEAAEKLAILPDIVLATNVAAANSDTGDPGRPAVGFDGTNYLIVFYRSSGDSPGLFGATISPKGSLLREFSITDLMNNNQSPHPALAFDGTNYLLVFDYQGGGKILGLRISPAGQVLDTNGAISISSGTPYQITNYRPSVAFDGHRYLVVWQKYIDPNFSIYGAFVTPDGQASSEFLIFSGSLWQTGPQVAFDGVNYFVVWENEHGVWPDEDLDIYGARVNQTGTVLDAPGVPICSAPYDQQSPALAFNGKDYMVVWLDERTNDSDPNIQKIYGTRVDTNCEVLDGPASAGGIPINTSAAEYKNNPRVCFDGCNFFVTWWVGSYGTGSFAARISTDGILIDGPSDGTGIPLRISDCYSCMVANPNPISNGRSVLVPWLDNAELGGTFKQVLANLIVPQPSISFGDAGNLGEPRITFQSRSNVSYTIESCADLTNWRELETTNSQTNGNLEIPLTTITLNSNLFFRLRIDY